MLTLTPKDMMAPVTDEERAQLTYLVNKSFDNNHDPALTLEARGIYVMMTMLKEAQDSIFEISKNL